jgi:hypothetical protein
VAGITELIHESRCITIHNFINEMDISFGSCQSLLPQDMKMGQMGAKFMSHLLAYEVQQNCVQTFSKNITDPQNLLRGQHHGSEAWLVNTNNSSEFEEPHITERTTCTSPQKVLMLSVPSYNIKMNGKWFSRFCSTPTLSAIVSSCGQSRNHLTKPHTCISYSHQHHSLPLPIYSS